MLALLATWFIVIATINAIGAPALETQAVTGLLAIVVLLVIMNWFFHRIYWTGWIGHHTKRRRTLFEKFADDPKRLMLGLALLGFTAIYREGFEIVLFLQSLRMQAGASAVGEGVLIGLAFTAIVGVLTFVAHHALPYKKMLIFTGVMLAFVLVVMVGENVQELQQAGWMSTTPVNLSIPDWMGTWFALFPNWEGLIGQALAAAGAPADGIRISFTPVLVPMARGILATSSAPIREGATDAEIRAAWERAYADEPFVELLPAGTFPRTADVLGANVASLGLAIDRAANRVVVVAAVDNLVKGTAGAAVQSMNIALGLPEGTALTVNGVAP